MYKLFSKISLVLIFIFLNTYIVFGATDNSIEYRDLLEEYQQVIYDQLLDNYCKHNTDSFDLNVRVSENEMYDIFCCFLYDNTDLINLDTSYNYYIKYGVVLSVKLNYYDDLDLSTYEVNLSKLVLDASNFKEDYMQIDHIYESLIWLDNYEETPHAQSAYSAIIEGNTVCAGYAKAFKNFCDRIGIKCYYIVGPCRGQSHAWNLVYVDNEYKFYDACFDDVDYMNWARNYKGISYESLSKDRQLSRLSQELINKLDNTILN